MAKTPAEVVAALQQQDIYSIICGLIYELQGIPEYSILSELCYLCDKDSFENILKYFSGKTISIPTKEEVSDSIKVLLLYQYYIVEKRPWKDCVLLAGYDSNNGKGAKNKLARLIEMLEKQNFGNREY